jgi:hypothetical protein
MTCHAHGHAGVIGGMMGTLIIYAGAIEEEGAENIFAESEAQASFVEWPGCVLQFLHTILVHRTTI